MAVLPTRVRTPLSCVLILGLLAAVYLLPADTSLNEVRKGGILRACMPPLYPPLVTGDANAPGIDVELLQALASGLGLRFGIHPNSAMGQDFNPRNWHITRAQCEVLAGGVVASPMTRSFLETSPAYAQTGWAFILPKPLDDVSGHRAGVLTGISGLDRLALSRYLRGKNVQMTIVPSAAELASGLRASRFDFGVTERLLAGQIGARESMAVEWAPEDLPRYPVVLGLWKGDLTLKRAIVEGLEKLRSDGELARIIAHYLKDAKLAQRPGSVSPGR
jgi:polar amino acid transport system substrate-binding protein/cystine transport system substrate-binding protein/membrane-bound lytic murein transglycosylase F